MSLQEHELIQETRMPDRLTNLSRREIFWASNWGERSIAIELGTVAAAHSRPSAGR